MCWMKRASSQRFLLYYIKSYFVCITLVGFKVMHNEPWFPAALGGKGEILKSVNTFSQPPSSALKYYFLVQLGYHLHSLLFMVFLSPIRSDFIEMLLHHVATIILIAGSFLTNYMAYGAIVVFTHDIGDVTGCTFIVDNDKNVQATVTNSFDVFAVLFLLIRRHKVSRGHWQYAASTVHVRDASHILGVHAPFRAAVQPHLPRDTLSAAE